MPTMLFKSPDVAAFRRGPDGGLLLCNRITGQSMETDPAQARLWTSWGQTGSLQGSDDQHVRRLEEGGVLTRAVEPDPIRSAACDRVSPQVPEKHVKWYAESPDLIVLFNTRSMSRNNPLLVLGPYGSLVWRGLVQRRPVGLLRRHAIRAFGKDEVVPFLRRLAGMGFLRLPQEFGPTAQAPEGVAKDFPAPEIQFQLTHAAVPWYCLWELCTACDLRCRICYLPHFLGSGPGTAAAMRISRQIVDAGVFYVALLGGEPLLRRDLEKIIEELRGEGVFVKVISNGIKLSQQRADSLAKAGLNQIEVSFDGLSAATHESSRGPGSFKRALAALQKARRSGIGRQAVVWTLHSSNAEEMAFLPEFLDAAGVTECYVSLFKKTGRQGGKAPFYPPSSSQIEELRWRIAGWRQACPELSIVLLPACSCGRTSIVIGHDSEIRLCTFSTASVGNLEQRSLGQVWQGLGDAAAKGPLGYCAI